MRKETAEFIKKEFWIAWRILKRAPEQLCCDNINWSVAQRKTGSLWTSPDTTVTQPYTGGGMFSAFPEPN
jgi:hypothetical protein